jgi:hypothetical protein
MINLNQASGLDDHQAPSTTKKDLRGSSILIYKNVCNNSQSPHLQDLLEIVTDL